MNKVLVSGKAQGIVLKSNDPINFLGTVDKKTGIVSDKNHDLFGTSIKDVILVFPSGVGSSVGAYTIYSIKSNKAAPLAMICKKADLTVATGCALANIPLITITDEKFSSLESGMKLLLDTDSSNLIHHQ
jgi:predicted aconitase with swiveling domain